VLPISVPETPSPLEFLLSVMNDSGADPALRVKAATTAAQYLHVRKVDGGKKDDTADKAKKAATGKFAAAQAPLKLVGHR
jgi:phage terminase small subunit